MFKVLKEKNQQPRLLYPARISFKIGGEIKSFSDKQKLSEFSTTKPALQKILKGFIWSRNRKKKDKNQPQIIKKMAIGTYISIITLKENGLNAPAKRHRLAEWVQEQDLYFAAYKKPTLDLKTHID